MLIDKPQCNFKNCRYCFDGNCVNASRYENCTMTDLHSEIARLRVDLDNAKADTVRKMQERLKSRMKDCCRYISNSREYFIVGEELIDQIAKEMLEDKK